MQQGPRFKPHPKSALGDFYVEDRCCLSCGIPHVVAPDLVGWVHTKRSHCFWIKQPKTADELTRAIAVLETQELGCHRYAGRDPEILKRISPEDCDYPLKPTISHIGTAAAPRSIQFAAPDHGTGLISKIWKMLTNT